MTRDMDLVREILLKLESTPSCDGGPVSLDVAERTEDEVAYHVLLLHEAGLVEAIDLSSQQGIDWRPVRLTWSGHEFLDAARDAGRWNQAKGIMKEKAGGMVFSILTQLLVKLTSSAVFGA